MASLSKAYAFSLVVVGRGQRKEKCGFEGERYLYWQPEERWCVLVLSPGGDGVKNWFWSQ